MTSESLKRISPVEDVVRSPWPRAKLEDVAEASISISGPILPFSGAQNIAAEQYRIIRTKILHHHKKPRLIVVTSASSGDGKTVTSINIAASFAMQGGEPILLVDADMRRPSIAHTLGIRRSPGLSEVLLGSTSLEAALIRAKEWPNLYILPAGEMDAGPAELLDSEEWLRFVERIRTQFRIVVFDATPAAAVADYELVQLICDGVIVVIRPDHTSRQDCVKTLQTAPKEKMLGVVMNCVEDWLFWRTPTYGYYKEVSAKKQMGWPFKKP